MSGSIIKKLDIQGFKSFPERTRILFHPGITAIVGPNGTGKSNIVDALLWVLGGQRARSLRAEKLDNIIFNGNTKKPPQGMADVTISLDDPAEELVITHRVFRSGESEYRINGKAVRLRDIQDELWKRSIGEKEYYVIEQGTIGQFVTSKPNEKRLLLEEAAGTAFYKDKKRQAENKLENSEQNLVRLEDIIEEIGRSKNSLQRQAQAANRYRKLREHIRELTALHYRRKLYQLEGSQAEAFRGYNDFILREKEALTRLAAAEKDLGLRRKEAWELERSLKQLQEAFYGLRSRVAHLETETESEGKKLGFFEERRKRGRRDIEERGQELELLAKEEAEATSQTADLEREMTRLKEEGEAAERRAREFSSRLSRAAEELETLRRGHLASMTQATEVKNERARLEKERELILRQEDKLTEKLNAARSRVEELEALLRRSEEALSGLLDRRLRAEEESSAALASRETCLRDLEALEAEETGYRDKMTQAAIHLEAIKKLLESRSGPGSAGLPQGAAGRLLDLIDMDADTASLLDLLWRDESGAAVVAAEDFLSSWEGGAPEGLYLLLGPPETRGNAHPADGEPGVLGRIKLRLRFKSDLAERLARLQDAVVVRDVQTAVSLWLRHPESAYITPEGSLLLPSGLLRVGGKEEGLFSLRREAKDLEEVIKRLEKESAPVTHRLGEKRSELEALEAKAAVLEVELGEIVRAIQDTERRKILLQAEMGKAGDDLDLLNKELEILRSEKQELAPRLDELGRLIAAREEEDALYQGRVDDEEAGLASLRRDAGRAEQGVFEARAAQDLVREKLEGLRRQIHGLGRRRETSLARQRAAEEDILLCDQEEARVREKIRNLETETVARKRERSDQETRVSTEESRLAELHKRQEALEERVNILRGEMEAYKEERVKIEVGKAEIERDLVNLEETCWQELKKNLAEVKAEFPEERLGGSEVEEELEQAKEDLLRYKAVNLMAEEEYLSQKERHDFLVKQRNDLRASIADTKEAIHKIDEESRSMFLTALFEVNVNFQQIFNLLFNGGTAEVKLTDPDNPLESGVDIAAQPPGKKLQSLTLLSGGEKSLTSLAFLFALFRYKPTPFCLLDEVDAALDDVNLARFLELMKKLKTETQFIIVTHNYKTMEVADYIYGTTMSEPNITSLLSVKLEKKDTAEKKDGA